MKYKTQQNLVILFVFFLFQTVAISLQLPEIIPHRGGKAERPENIIQSFKECINLGAETLEMDVQVTKDGQVVIYHPGDLSVHTEAKGKISEFTYAELQKMDAAYKYEVSGVFPERGKGHKIPLFEDILKMFPETKVIVDLKSLPARDLIEAVAQVAHSQNAWGRLIFYSTDDSHLDYLKKYYPQANAFESRRDTVEELLNATGSTRLSKTEKPIWFGFELERQGEFVEKLALGDARYPIKFVMWTEPGVKRIRNKLPQARFVMFGINTVEDYQKAAILGAYAVYSDTPTLLFDFTKKK